MCAKKRSEKRIKVQRKKKLSKQELEKLKTDLLNLMDVLMKKYESIKSNNTKDETEKT